MAINRETYKSVSLMIGKYFRQLAQPKEFRITNIYSINQESLQEIIVWLKRIEIDQKSANQPQTATTEFFTVTKLLTETATGLWRARKKLIAPGSKDEPIDAMRGVFRPLDSTYQSLNQSGLEIFDLTDQPYVTGMIEKVIAFEPTIGITGETIKETIKPTIYFRDQLMQVGEVIVGTVDLNGKSIRKNIN